ncbi:MAG: Rpn family recombination-promoting nuclease/putative transposase [Alkalispirochaeta sp.]
MEIHHAHDRFFRSFFSQPTHLRFLIRNALPAEVTATLDLNSLKLEPGTWIDRKNREHLSDLPATSADTLRGNPASRAALWLMRTVRSGRGF